MSSIKSPNADFELKDIDIEIVEILLNLLKKKKETISYKELASKLPSNPNPHFGLTKPLFRIGRLCYQLELPFITCCVITSSSKLPGAGIAALYEECGISTNGKSVEKLYKEERDKVRDCNSWQKLADYLHIDIQMTVNGEVIYPDDIPQYIEGATKHIYVNSYERDRYARNACIEYYSNKDNGRVKCQVCGFDFEEKYGEKYKNIIEVHHIIPLSEIKQSYKVNPIKDLLPVCPNCHVVLHSNVGESIEELKERLMKE